MSVEVTKDGRVFNSEGIEKKQSNHSAGYKIVTIENKTKYVHRLVAEKYIPNPDNKPCINHINGIKSDNRIENLEWVTYLENNQHAKQNKLWGKNIIDRRKLTNELADEIRKKYIPKKYTIKKLANEYEVDYKTMWNVINYKSYINKYIKN